MCNKSLLMIEFILRSLQFLRFCGGCETCHEFILNKIMFEIVFAMKTYFYWSIFHFIREEMVEPSCSLMQWTFLLGEEKTETLWRVFTLSRMSTVVIAVNCWGGSMNEHMNHHRDTRKGSSYLRNQRLWRRTGSGQSLDFICLNCNVHVV